MRQQEGFTLVELLVTLAVIGVLVGVVFPGFRGLMDRNSMTTSANAMVLAVNYARSEAMRGTGIVRVRARGATPAWANGWEVVGPDDDVIRFFEPINSALSLVSMDGVNLLRFNNQGLLVAGEARVFELCLPGNSGVQITIAPTGRPSTAAMDAAACPA